MRLIVGLGNPGSEYVGTRHNVGFDALDRLADRLGWATAGQFGRLAKAKFDGLLLDGQLDLAGGGSEKLLLLKPLTFMNLSGRCVRQVMDFYQVSVDGLLVLLDDLALPCGAIRLRPGGSSGGHNGLKDIERVLGSDKYPRLRIGIDPTPPRIAGRDYVLQRFTTEQQIKLDPALTRAAGACVTWADQGINKAMNQFNTGKEVEN